MRSLIVLSLAVVLLAVQGCSVVSSITGKVSAGSADRRSAGSQVDDESIEVTVLSRIQDKFKGKARVTVTSFNRFVLLTGDAATNEMKTNIERLVYSVPNVKQIANEISIGGLSSASTRGTDSSISKDIKYDLAINKSLRPGTIKVTTEKGVVYLLGLVTHAEAKVASEIASTSMGVQKVVRAFEYIDQLEK